METTTNEGHRFYYSGKDDKHEHGVGSLIHKYTVNSLMGCRPVSSRIITIRMRASPFNITIIQAYAPTSNYDDTEIEAFYDQLQEVFDETPKKDILIAQGDWNAKIGEDATKDWKGICGSYSNSQTNERGLLLLEFASSNDLFLKEYSSQQDNPYNVRYIHTVLIVHNYFAPWGVVNVLISESSY